MTDREIEKRRETQVASIKLEKPFKAVLKDGTPFEINRAVFRHNQVMAKLVEESSDSRTPMQIKYCTKITKASEEGVLCGYVFFPEQYLHGEKVDHPSSAINGNIVIRNGRIQYSTSNHPSSDLDSEFNYLVPDVLEHAEEVFQEWLDQGAYLS